MPGTISSWRITNGELSLLELNLEDICLVFLSPSSLSTFFVHSLFSSAIEHQAISNVSCRPTSGPNFYIYSRSPPYTSPEVFPILSFPQDKTNSTFFQCLDLTGDYFGRTK
jgi:hypothetical protein